MTLADQAESAMSDVPRPAASIVDSYDPPVSPRLPECTYYNFLLSAQSGGPSFDYSRRLRGSFRSGRLNVFMDDFTLERSRRLRSDLTI